MATIAEVERKGPQVLVLVVLSDGSEKFVQRYAVVPSPGFDGMAWLAREARATVEALTPAKDVDALFVRGSTIDLTPTTAEDPDPALTTFRADYSRLAAMKRMIDAGVMEEDKTYTDLLGKVRAEFDSRFIGTV